MLFERKPKKKERKREKKKSFVIRFSHLHFLILILCCSHFLCFFSSLFSTSHLSVAFSGWHLEIFVAFLGYRMHGGAVVFFFFFFILPFFLSLFSSTHHVRSLACRMSCTVLLHFANDEILPIIDRFPLLILRLIVEVEDMIRST